MDIHTPASRPHRSGLSRRSVLHAGAMGCAAGLATSLGACVSPPMARELDEASAYALAKEAYLYAYPLAYFARLRHTRLTQSDPVARTVQRVNAFQHVNAPVTPATAGAPQTDTFYSRLWHDVSREPLLIDVPAGDGRYWSLQMVDFFGTTFGLPNRRNLRQAGVIAIVGPDWQGRLPSHVSQTFRTPTSKGFSLLRMFFAGPADQARAVQMQTGFVARPLSVHLAGGPWDGVDGGAVFRPAAVAADPLADFKAMAALWNEAPPPAADRAITRPFASLGLAVAGVPVDQLGDAVKRGMARAEAEVRALIVQTTRAVPGTRTANGWVMPKPSIGRFDDGDWLYRAACALFGTICTPVDENVYVAAQHEPGFAKRLHGSSRYELHFSRDSVPRAGAFWSVHAYTDRYTLIPHPAARFSVGDRTPGLAYGADGSLTVLLQPDAPEPSRQANWMATLRDQPFSLLVRAYEPLGAMRDLSWQGPLIRVLGAA